MKKFYVSNVEELNDEEKRTGCVSYGRIIERYIGNLVLCNEVVNIEENFWDNIQVNGEIGDYEEFYQFYLCSLSSFEKDRLLDYGIILSYSNKLELDILCVNHFGTSWDYVMTDVKWTTNFDEVK